MDKGVIRGLIIALVIVGLIALAWFLGSWYGQKMILDSYQDTSDTVVRYVTVYKEYPEPMKTVQTGFVSVPIVRFLTDTIHKENTIVLHDTTTQVVYLPREEKYYSEMEGKLRLWISGYEPRLDKWEFDAPQTTITKTVYVKPSRWSFTISAGWGLTYDLTHKTFGTGPSVVIGGSYTLF